MFLNFIKNLGRNFLCLWHLTMQLVWKQKMHLVHLPICSFSCSSNSIALQKYILETSLLHVLNWKFVISECQLSWFNLVIASKWNTSFLLCLHLLLMMHSNYRLLTKYEIFPPAVFVRLKDWGWEYFVILSQWPFYYISMLFIY